MKDRPPDPSQVKAWLERAKWQKKILGKWRMPKRNAKSDHVPRKNQTRSARVMGERTENVSGCCRGFAHSRKPSRNATWCPTCRSGTGADILWLAGVFNVDIKSIQGMLINIHLCVLIMVSERRCHTDVGREGSTNRSGLCTPFEKHAHRWRRSDNCSDSLKEICVRKVGQP